jgi:hypothetical protein
VFHFGLIAEQPPGRGHELCQLLAGDEAHFFFSYLLG